jgi:hypothetical protein
MVRPAGHGIAVFSLASKSNKLSPDGTGWPLANNKDVGLDHNCATRLT